MCRYGCPLEIVTDQGGHFVNDVLKELLQRMSVKHRRASPYYPQANGLVEKTNGILIGIIAKVVDGQRKKWDQHVGEALWAYRTAHKLATGYTPF
jgi:transposase InsO family protein